ncbi:DUF1003 domain-containing protein [Sinorhizobium medicae]|nr:DUF1003 domain-containing protein [Sinorhizobium medicae]MDX0677757.1 DUF1003 domain-containing protein [Sinorhizobium medicae]MDX0720532.1 DUF1003 domain-containing protein [Sinorhizobium medicae]MDX0904756.1 DUF1003 domain-containing protein [Sinorhizobium medicae]MDX0955363.1 DUF1003 domain-containing protein [Sinorhizobium medicae]
MCLPVAVRARAAHKASRVMISTGKSAEQRSAARTMPRLERNISAILKRREEEERGRHAHDRLAQAITTFAGSMTFVCLHVLVFGAWIAANLGLVPNVPVFDPTFAILAMIASVEAIFISTFVLISQNRMAEKDDERSDLNLQISLLAEQEATQLLTLLREIAGRLGVKVDGEEEIRELSKEVTPEEILNRLEDQKVRSGE